MIRLSEILDDIRYGNSRKDQIEKIKKDKGGILKRAIQLGIVKDILENHPFPANSSDETKRELEYLIKITNEANEDDLKFCELMEHHHHDFFIVVAKKLGLDVSKEQILNWVGNLDPVLFYLKDKFNRPRPYQLAKEYGMELYPIIATDANSAAYPSGHTLDFLNIIYQLKKLKPEATNSLDNLYNDIKIVREMSGVHYPSDTKVSEYLFQQLVKNKLV